MKKCFVCFLMFMIAIPIFAQRFASSGLAIVDKIKETTPARIVENMPDGVIVTYQFDSFVKQADPIYEGTFSVKIDGFGQNSIGGEPAFPVRWDSFVVPQNVSVSVSVLDSSYVDYNFELTPAKEDQITSINEPYSKNNVSPIKAYSGFYPSRLTPKSMLRHYRGTPVISVCLNPVQYDFQNKKVRIFKSITYKIVYGSKNRTQRLAKTSSGYISPRDQFLRNTVLNYAESSFTRSASPLPVENKVGYLIVSTNTFKSPVNTLALWKKKLGFNVKTLLKDQWADTVEVKSAIRAAYEADSTLYYLLIIGGHQVVPSESRSKTFRVNVGFNIIHYKTYDYVTDLYYGCMDDDDLPELMRGRIPARTIAEASCAISKIINYEMNPYTGADFYNRGIHCAYFQDMNCDDYEDVRFVKTSEEIRDYMQDSVGKSVSRIYYSKYYVDPTYWNNGSYSNGEEIPLELQRPNYSWEGNASDISYQINNGVFYVLYRDHGNSTAWINPAYTVNDIDSLNNGNKLPVVFSLCCQTGMFQLIDECFCEKFLYKSNSGCVGIYGATQTSFSGSNDALGVGMFDAIWPNPGLTPQFHNNGMPSSQAPVPTFRLGQILDQGIVRMFENWPNLKSNKYTQELFHCFGDPSMRIYTVQPTSFNNANVFRDVDHIEVGTGGEVATITFYNKATGEVKSYETDYVDLECPDENLEDILVCISAHNKIPYIDEENTVYIQNSTINGPVGVDGDYIKVGSNVKYDTTEGPVIVNSGSTTLCAKTVVLSGETTVKNGATLIIDTSE